MRTGDSPLAVGRRRGGRRRAEGMVAKAAASEREHDWTLEWPLFSVHD